MTAELTRYDLAEARLVDEVKDIRDKAVAWPATRGKQNRSLETDAVEIRMRATRKLDELQIARLSGSTKTSLIAKRDREASGERGL